MKKFKFFAKLLPDIIGVVNVIEAASNGKTKIGAQKAALALDMIKSGVDVAEGIEGQEWLQVVPGIQKTIDAYVKFANGVGLFKKSN